MPITMRPSAAGGNSEGADPWGALAGAVATALVAWGAHTYLTYDPRWWWARRARSDDEVPNAPGWRDALIHGSVAPGWEAVRDKFVANFARRGELGAAFCVYFRGEVVVDLWGGYRDRAARAPWARDTCWASTRAPSSS